MKAFVVDRYGINSALRLGEMPEPEVREQDVLVAIHAASLNQLDAKIRSGDFKLILRYHLPLVLGNDVAGVVVRVGSGVRGFKPGDEVYARPHQDRIGTFAELIAMNEADVALKPGNLTMEEAASIPLVGLTAWQVLVERADVVIDYKKEEFAKVLNDYDVVLNSLGKDTLAKSLDVLKPGGKLISISGPPDLAFAKESGLNWFLQQIMRLLSFGIRWKARRRGISY